MTQSNTDEIAEGAHDEMEHAAARVAWRLSPEASRWRRVAPALALSLILISALLGAGAGYFAYSGSTSGRSDGVMTNAFFGLMIGLVVALYAVGFAHLTYRRAFRDRRLTEQARSELEQAEASLSSGAEDTDFSSLWQITQKRLDYYHQIATSQSEKSFRYGQIAAGVGMVVILICAALAAVSRSTAGSVATALLGAAGGGLAGYIGSTFMRTQDLASRQLREYFSQPLEFSRFLAAERLLGTITDATVREQVTARLIETMVIVGRVSALQDPHTRDEPRT